MRLPEIFIRPLPGIVLLTVLWTFSVHAEPELIRLSHSHQAVMSSEIHTTAVAFRDFVNEHSAGELEVRIYPNNSLGQEREVYEAMQFGAGADCVISGTAILSNFYRRTGVLDLPFLWKDLEHMHRALDGEAGTQLARELERVNFKVLAWLDSWGARNVITAEQPVTRPEDLKGLKIRTIPSPVYIATVNALGASATPMAFGEIYTSLETGVLDGFEHTPTVILSGRFFEVAKHLTLTRHLYGPLVFVCSIQSWQGLSAQRQSVLAQAAIYAQEEQRSQTRVRELQALKALEAEGVFVHDIDVSAFEADASELRLKLAAKMKAGDLLSRIVAEAGDSSQAPTVREN